MEYANLIGDIMKQTKQKENFKVNNLIGNKKDPGFKLYKRLYYGDVSLGNMICTELILMVFGPIPGAIGIFLRSKLYPMLFKKSGKNIFIGRNVTFRHLKKINLGNNVVIDDNCMIDAKGENNEGIFFEDNVFIGRNSIIYCKNGDIKLEKNVNISSNCTIFSSNYVHMKKNSIVGAYSYFLSGGEYDYKDKTTPFSQQSGMNTKGKLIIGENCWFGARVTVLDSACVGNNCVVGAGTVVTKKISNNSLVLGVPGKIVKKI